MNFTREPIIETIITPKEGHKLIVQSSKGSGHEEYSVEAIEVVSFGRSFFYRSLERPKAFLVPVSDYEVIEAKETRVVLKNASFEKAIKIGGGREALPKVKEKAVESDSEESEPAAVEQRLDKKRERRRHRRRRGSSGEGKEASEAQAPSEEGAAKAPAPETSAAAPSVPSMINRLIPPPPLLISDKYAKEKSEAAKAVEVSPPSAEAEGEDKEKGKRSRRKKTSSGEGEVDEDFKEADNSAENWEIQRMAAAEEATTTSFSTTKNSEGGKFSIFGKFW